MYLRTYVIPHRGITGEVPRSFPDLFLTGYNKGLLSVGCAHSLETDWLSSFTRVNSGRALPPLEDILDQ
jgi:hypothetical protein